MAQFGHTGKMLCKKYLYQPEISCMETWHTTCFRENNNGESKRYTSENLDVINVFHDANSILYTGTNINPKAGFYWKISIFP